MLIIKVLIFAVVLASSRSVESASICEKLNDNFAVLLETATGLLDTFTLLSFQYASKDPVLANGFVSSLGCKAEQVQVLTSMGISRLTGIDSSLISSILYGQMEPPFTSPLDCIEAGLLTLRVKRENISNVELESLAALFQPTTVDPESSCEDLEQLAGDYASKFYPLSEEIIASYKKYFPKISSINMLDLYMSILEPLTTCELQAVAILAADIVNGSQTEALDYVDGAITELSHPLSCISNSLNLVLGAIKQVYGQLASLASNYKAPMVQESSSQAESSSSSVCGGIKSILELKEAGLKGINSIKSYSTEQAQVNPELVPAIVDDLLCRSNGFLLFIAQAVEKITGIASIDAHGVLLNLTSPPFLEPLSCISSDLIEIRDANLNLKNDFVVFLNGLQTIPGSIENASCPEIRDYVSGYNESLESILNDNVFILAEIQSFKKYGMLEQLSVVVQSQLNCKLHSLAVLFSTILTSNVDDAENFILNSQEPVSPYNCTVDEIRSAIDRTNEIYNNILNGLN